MHGGWREGGCGGESVGVEEGGEAEGFVGVAAVEVREGEVLVGAGG